MVVKLDSESTQKFLLIWESFWNSNYGAETIGKQLQLPLEQSNLNSSKY